MVEFLSAGGQTFGSREHGGRGAGVDVQVGMGDECARRSLLEHLQCDRLC